MTLARYKFTNRAKFNLTPRPWLCYLLFFLSNKLRNFLSIFSMSEKEKSRSPVKGLLAVVLIVTAAFAFYLQTERRPI